MLINVRKCVYIYLCVVLCVHEREREREREKGVLCTTICVLFILREYILI